MKSEDLQAYLDFAKDIAYRAGEVMRRYFNADDAGTIAKDDSSPLTVADTTINRMLIEAVQDRFSDHGVLGEEESFGVDRKSVWICDPIDGTSPFTHGIPLSVFSLALTIDGFLQVAVLYDPYMDRLVSAVQGQGAWLNDKKLDLRAHEPVAGWELVAVEIWSGSNDQITDQTVMSQAFSLFKGDQMSPIYFASMATAGLLVATGSLMATVAAAGYQWDVAAQDLIIREAGGIVSDWRGNREPRNYKKDWQPGVIAARNEQEYKKVYSIIQPVLAKYNQGN